MALNPNSDKTFINNCDIENEHIFPLFFKEIKFDVFRHIRDLRISFVNPITVISGSNKSGKTTILLSIACSHYNFKKRDSINGSIKRTKWGNVIKFTSADIQTEDWTYHVKYREGVKSLSKKGQRKHLTNKWNGVAKKESQIGTPTPSKPNGGRNVILIDLQRIIPVRNVSNSVFNKSRYGGPTPLGNIKNEYLSYILETTYSISSLVQVGDKEVFGFSNYNHYSSYNSASGEDVLTRMISDIVDAENNSLILIEELEIGLHPKIQRRLMDIIYHESNKNKKQFVITTHSPVILSSVEPKSRVFITKIGDQFKAISNISINAALSKMDSYSYPLINIFVEDDVSELILEKVITGITANTIHGFSNLVNIIIIGSADKTYNCFIAHRDTYENKKIACGFACVLDGDRRNLKKGGTNDLQYPPEKGLFFHSSNFAPEKMLLQKYINQQYNSTLEYHANHSNPHCLFQKMIEEGICSSKNEAFEVCWNAFSSTADGQTYIVELSEFLIDRCRVFSADL